MKRILYAMIIVLLCIGLAACGSPAQNNNQGGSPTQNMQEGIAGGMPNGMPGGMEVEDADAPEREADLFGTVLRVTEEGMLIVSAMENAGIPEGSMQPPPDDNRSARPNMPSPGSGNGNNPDAGGRPVPQGEETEISITEQSVIKQIAADGDESVITIQAADIKENAVVRIWLGSNGAAEYVQVMADIGPRENV